MFELIDDVADLLKGDTLFEKTYGILTAIALLLLFVGLFGASIYIGIAYNWMLGVLIFFVLTIGLALTYTVVGMLIGTLALIIAACVQLIFSLCQGIYHLYHRSRA